MAGDAACCVDDGEEVEAGEEGQLEEAENVLALAPPGDVEALEHGEDKPEDEVPAPGGHGGRVGFERRGERRVLRDDVGDPDDDVVGGDGGPEALGDVFGRQDREVLVERGVHLADGVHHRQHEDAHDGEPCEQPHGPARRQRAAHSDEHPGSDDPAERYEVDHSVLETRLQPGVQDLVPGLVFVVGLRQLRLDRHLRRCLGEHSASTACLGAAT